MCVLVYTTLWKFSKMLFPSLGTCHIHPYTSTIKQDRLYSLSLTDFNLRKQWKILESIDTNIIRVDVMQVRNQINPRFP